MALNGLEPTDKAFMVWDMRTQPSDEMLAQGPWDIAFSEVATLLMMKFNEDSEYDLNTLNSIMADVLPTLFALPVKRFVFVGKYRQLYDQALTGIHWVTTSIMYSLASLGRRPMYREPCRGGAVSDSHDGNCDRHPTISPKFWLYKHGIAPPTDHSGWVVW
eukprot:TRINITY_DN30146_c0_g1_i1.p1 TRINITY_DN30146_c0_g1~~TRINITY_DN30146_c0_g1_i1.p1  ORF type:complete len:161 (+),score=18.51 TRINITY_DN30146_c0_g1_i1:676-1158(+)